ncbi:MAG TPA: hypothetical protein VF219_11330 [Vicinamibacterales bacterium]
MTTRQSAGKQRSHCSSRPPAKPYAFVSRGPDDRLRTERFRTAAEYRVRLASAAKDQPISLDQLISILD